MNLVSNAVKFTEVGNVVISSTAVPVGDGKWKIKFAVKDTGIGLSKEAIGRLFLPFSQMDASTTRRFGGSGLGLAICHGHL